jgi:hypothetical protein
MAVLGLFPPEANSQRLRLPRPPVPDLPQIPRPPASGLGAVVEDARYGVNDAAIVLALDDAGRALGDDVDNFARQYRIESEASTLRECTGNGLRAAGEEYATALQEAAALRQPIPAPDPEVAVAGAADCLTTYYPGTPDIAVAVAHNLISLAAERAQAAYDAAPVGATLAEWMQVTGSELAEIVTPDDGTGSTTTSEEDGLPVWLVVLIIVALGAGGTALVKAMSGSERAGPNG